MTLFKPAPRVWYLVLVLVCLLVVGLVSRFVSWPSVLRKFVSSPSELAKPAIPEEPPMARAFEGDSKQLQSTVVLPTLGSPIPDGKSVIWCLSFQIAWNQIKDFVHGPVRVRNAEAVAERLNDAPESADDIDSDAYYAAAGLMKDRIDREIRKEMAARFPDHPVPAFDVPLDGFISYAYLQTGIKYTFSFFQNDEGFLFIDSAGKRTPVQSFGIRKKDEFKGIQGDSFRSQVKVLWEAADRKSFAVDLCKTSKPNQIVLALLERRPTLAEMLAYLEEKIQRDITSHLEDEDVLLVPNMSWSMDHYFRELEGKQLLNPNFTGMRIGAARQTVEFRLDRRGASLASEAVIPVLDGGTRALLFNHPFLLYLKKRGARHPFFVMWVDNVELMNKP